MLDFVGVIVVLVATLLGAIWGVDGAKLGQVGTGGRGQWALTLDRGALLGFVGIIVVLIGTVLVAILQFVGAKLGQVGNVGRGQWARVQWPWAVAQQSLKAVGFRWLLAPTAASLGQLHP